MKTVPSHDDVLAYFDELSNWGRWGAEDQLGTLNLVTPAKRVEAARLVTEGLVVPLGMDLDPADPDPLARDTQLRIDTQIHHLGERIQGVREIVEMQPHGSPTHLDAPSHMGWDGKLYNGFPASAVTPTGAGRMGVEHARGGIVTRGVLLDVAGVRGVDWLEPGEAIHVEDLEAAEERQGVRVAPGDFLIVRTGYLERVAAEGTDDKRANGYHAGCLPWLRERDVAVISCDALNDIQPSGYGLERLLLDIPHDEWADISPKDLELLLPVHCVALVAMGAWLVDNVVVTELLETCKRLNRWAFLVTIEPLRLVGASGSQVNPLAIF